VDRRCRWIIAVLILASVARPTGIARASNGFARWGFSVTYDPSSRQSVLEHLNQLDVVVPGYFTLQTSGTIGGHGDTGLDAAVAASGVRSLPLVQNQISGANLSPYLNDDSHRPALVAAIAALPTAGSYDGITLDFEGLDLADRGAFSRFVQDLASALHARQKLLAVAIPATDGAPVTGWAAPYDQSAIGAAADRVILMAYAFRSEASTNPGSIAPLPWVTGSVNYSAALVPRNRLILGLGMWGDDWNVTQRARPAVLRYAQTADLMAQTHGQISLDAPSATNVYTYQNGADQHQIWYEDAASVQRKLALATLGGLAGVALWRLGQEAPGVWDDLRVIGLSDFAVSNGHFFTQTGGGGGRGFWVVDDRVRFWSEFQRLGGLATLGYPSSRRYVGADGFTYQVFQRGILQWRPEADQAYLANTFDQLTAAGRDRQLASIGIPLPIADDGSQGIWSVARQTRLGWLSEASIARAFRANPNPSAIADWNPDRAIQLYGLPASLPQRSGPFVVQRFQRISLQLWVDAVPGMPPPGSVVGILGGDLVKSAGVVPAAAAQPEAPF
jgi:spore germination protein